MFWNSLVLERYHKKIGISTFHQFQIGQEFVMIHISGLRSAEMKRHPNFLQKIEACDYVIHYNFKRATITRDKIT